MQLYTPQVQLFHELVDEGPDEYLLHVVTFTDQTNLRAAGYSIVSSAPDENNTIQVELYIQGETDVPELYSLNPVVHTIEAGPIDFNGNGFFTVDVILQEEGARTSGSSQGTTTTSTTSSKKVHRPEGEVLKIPVLFP